MDHATESVREVKAMRQYILSILLSVVFASGSHARVYTVLADGTGDYPSIQAAVLAVDDYGVILLENGIYSGVGNRDIEIAGRRITITSAGNASECVIDCQGLGQGIVLGPDDGPGTILNGITIRNASAYGIYCGESADPIIVGCTVESCVNGVYIGVFSSPTFIDCIVRDNDDSGIRTTSFSSGDILGSRIEANGGTGIQCASGQLDIVGSELRGNRSGLSAYSNAFFDLAASVVVGNGTATYGGGIYVSEGVFRVYGSTIAGNTAARGGGIYVAEDAFPIYLTRSVVWANCASTAGDEIYIEGQSPSMAVTCSAIDSSGVFGNYILNGPSVFDDPDFCDPAPCGDAPTVAGDYTVSGASPCLPAASPCGQLIGAYGNGCTGPPAIDLNSAGRLRPALFLADPRQHGASADVCFEIDSRPGEDLNVQIFDASGRLCASVASGRAPGPRTVIWDGRMADGRSAPAGVYFVRAASGTTQEARRFVMLR